MIVSGLALGGLYDGSGTWFFETGLIGKSGVGGGIIGVSPGVAAFASISPPLDAQGNSVKGQVGAAAFARALGDPVSLVR